MADNKNPNIEVGDYFLGLTCSHCGNVVPFGERPTKKPRNVKIASHESTNPAKFKTKCNACGKGFEQPVDTAKEFKLIGPGEVEEA